MSQELKTSTVTYSVHLSLIAARTFFSGAVHRYTQEKRHPRMVNPIQLHAGPVLCCVARSTRPARTFPRSRNKLMPGVWAVNRPHQPAIFLFDTLHPAHEHIQNKTESASAA